MSKKNKEKMEEQTCNCSEECTCGDECNCEEHCEYHEHECHCEQHEEEHLNFFDKIKTESSREAGTLWIKN